MVLQPVHFRAPVPLPCAGGSHPVEQRRVVARWRAHRPVPLMAVALEDNPDGVVLFSTSRPERFGEIVGERYPREALKTVREEISRMSLTS
jgi:hypothetical protein